MAQEQGPSEVISTPPDPKRRRLNGYASSSVLTKPFKSPFRTPLKPSQDRAVKQSLKLDDNSVKEQAIGEQVPAHSTLNSTPTFKKPTAPHYLRTPVNASFPLSKPSPAADAATVAALRTAQRHTTSLSTTIAATKRDIDALKQAISLSTSNTDPELEELIYKWRSAARGAAEEVFSSCRDKVNSMGGVGAWREREQEQRDWRKSWQQDEPSRGGGTHDEEEDEDDDEDGERDGVSKEERRMHREMRREFERQKKEELEGEREEAEEDHEQVKEGEDVWKGAEDDSFTMGMMLKTLNISLDVLGYDNKQERWVG